MHERESRNAERMLTDSLEEAGDCAGDRDDYRLLLGVLVVQPLQTDQHAHADHCQQHSGNQDGITACHGAAIQGLVERDHRRTVREPNPTEPQHTLATKSRGPVPAQQHDCGHNQAGGGIGEQYRAERAWPVHQA